MMLTAWWRVQELVWVMVAVVGLVIAIRRWRRGQPAARWATAAFVVMLAKASYILGGLAERLILIPHVYQLLQAAGFALLVPAIFAGRQSVTSDDPDAAG